MSDAVDKAKKEIASSFEFDDRDCDFLVEHEVSSAEEAERARYATKNRAAERF